MAKFAFRKETNVGGDPSSHKLSGSGVNVFLHDEGEHLHVFDVYSDKGKPGPAKVRQGLHALRDAYPKAKTVGGERVSGARKFEGAPPDAPYVKLKLR